MLSNLLRRGALLVLLNASVSFAADCPDWESLVQVSSPTVTVPIHRNRSTPEISKWAEESRPGEAQGIAFTSYKQEARILKSATAASCYRPAVLVKLMPDPSEVYIAKEVEPGSCFDEQLLEHEFKHIYAGHRALANNISRIRRDLIQALAKVSDAYVTDEIVLRTINHTVHKALRYVIDEVNFENQKIDSEKEAVWLHRNCGYATGVTQTQVLHAPPIIRSPVGYQDLDELPVSKTAPPLENKKPSLP